MKQLLTLLLIILSLQSFAQDTRPANAATLKLLQTPSFSYNLPDSSLWLYKNKDYGWTKMASYYKTQYKIDSVRNSMYSKMYEVEVSVEGQTSYTIPFTLRSKTMVYYNGILLRSSQWFGVGTTYITIGVETRINDYIKIQN
jgi:hypothetical protein